MSERLGFVRRRCVLSCVRPPRQPPLGFVRRPSRRGFLKVAAGHRWLGKTVPEPEEVAELEEGVNRGFVRLEAIPMLRQLASARRAG